MFENNVEREREREKENQLGISVRNTSMLVRVLGV